MGTCPHYRPVLVYNLPKMRAERVLNVDPKLSSEGSTPEDRRIVPNTGRGPGLTAGIEHPSVRILLPSL